MKMELDSPVWTKAEPIADVLVAGFLWLVCSIPVITAGAAGAALYYTVVKVIRRKRETVVKAFLHSFKDNLKQGVGVSVFYLVYGALLVFYGYLVAYGGVWEENPYLAVAAGMVLAMPFIFTLPYIFPVMSRFQFKTFRLFLYALHMSVGHFMSTIVLTVLWGMVCLAVYLIPFSVVLLPGVYAYISSFLLERIFRKYLDGERGEYDGEGGLPWYLE